MSRVRAVGKPPSTNAPPESKSPTSEESGASNANKEQETGLTNSIRLAQKVREALEKGSSGYELYSPKGCETKEEGATTLLSIGNAAYKVLYININDIRAWSQVYGAAPAVVLATFGRKSVWKMQAELLGRPGRPGPGDSGDPDDPDDPGGPGGAWGRRGTNDQAAEEYKRTIETESQRIGVSGTIIASITVIALTLPSLSQTHWVARASWIFSLVSSLLAVYYANNQVWKVGYLLLGNRVRAWIRGHSKGPRAYIKENNNQGPHLAKLVVRSLVPAPSSVLLVSAPGLLLSASLYFFLIGFGVYLGFMWTRALDDLAGPDDNRDVFIIYLVSLIFCYGLYSMSDIAHDRQATDAVGGTIQHSMTKLVTRYDMSERKWEERRKETVDNLDSERRHMERRGHMLDPSMQIDLLMEILKELKETNALMKLTNIATGQEDSY